MDVFLPPARTHDQHCGCQMEDHGLITGVFSLFIRPILSDYYLFLNVNEQLKGLYFEDIESVMEAAKNLFREKSKDFYLRGVEKLQQRRNKSHGRIC